jgi:hypothetical protein
MILIEVENIVNLVCSTYLRYTWGKLKLVNIRLKKAGRLFASLIGGLAMEFNKPLST